MNYLTAPTQSGEVRGADATGNGWYGAKRGNRLHKGCDYKTTPGEAIFAVCKGYVRLGNVYAKSKPGKPTMRLVEISGPEYRAKQMYVKPIVKNGAFVEMGQQIGLAQNVTEYHTDSDTDTDKNMTNHCHVSLWKFGLLTDPEPVLKIV